MTVYTVRLITGYSRGSALSEPHSAVNLALISRGGQSVLHRIAPINDAASNSARFEQMCEAVGDGARDMGANCVIPTQLSTPSTSSSTQAASGSGQSSPAGSSVVTRRFLEGAVDEVSFAAPELGPLAALLVGCEAGSWVLEEVTVASSRTRNTDRFVCRRRLGRGAAGDPAAYLTAVPAGAVVFGTGDNTLMLSKAEAAAMQEAGLAEYEALKGRMTGTTAVLAVAGSALFTMAVGPGSGLAFGLGGAAAVVYTLLLQQSVDSLGAGSAGSSGVGGSSSSGSGARSTGEVMMQRRRDAARSPLRRLLGAGPVRLGLLGLAGLLGAWALQEQGGGPISAQPPASAVLASLPDGGLHHLLLGALGFFTYKLAGEFSAHGPASACPLRKSCTRA